MCCKNPQLGFKTNHVQIDLMQIFLMWKELQENEIRGSPSFFYQNLSCYSVNNELTGAYTYNRTFCEKFNGEYSCSSVAVDHTIRNGKASFIQKIKMVSSVAVLVFKNYFGFFFSYYFCQNLENGQSQTSLQIESRNPTLSDELVKKAL